jgi:PKD repeat protein
MAPTYVKTVSGQPATVLYIDPPSINVTHDDIDTTFQVNVTIADVADLKGFGINVTWDNSLITFVSVNFTATLNNIWGARAGNWDVVDNTTGVGFYDLAALSLASSFNGTGPTPLYQLTFNVEDPETNSARNCSIHFAGDDLSNSVPSPIPHTVTDGNYTIAAAEATVLITPSLTEKTYSDVNTTFDVNVTVETVTDLFSFDINITWDSTLLNFSNCYYNDTLDALWGPGQWSLAENESGVDNYELIAESTANSFNTTLSQTMFTLEFIVEMPPQPNETMIHFATDTLNDSQAENIPNLAEDGTYRFGSTLTVTTVGSGSVTESPNQFAYLNGTIVTLTASPAIGWSFAGWSGDASGLAEQTTVNMTDDESVTATFTENVYTLLVTIVGQGNVVLNDSGPYYFGDVVQLSASPAAGWGFDYWSGALSGSVNPTTLTISGDASVTATFTQTTQNIYTLTVSVDGNGSVSLNETGPYNYGDVVQLTATANTSWSFLSWSGSLTGNSNPATLTMTGNFSVTAYFTQLVAPQAVFTYSPSEPYVNMTVTFDASASTAGSNASIVGYEWNFGDGSPEVNNTVSTTAHVYTLPNNYTVTLNVTNSEGLWSTTSETVEVAPPEPQAEFTWYPAIPRANLTVTFDATSSKLGWNGTAQPPIVNYTWNFGDGNITSGYYPTIHHTYTNDGNYTVTLTVVDSNGLEGNITKTVTVQTTVVLLELDRGRVNILDAVLPARAFGSYCADYDYEGD